MGLSSTICGQRWEFLNWFKWSIISVTHPFRNIRALYTVFLSTEAYMVTYQFNCSCANNCYKDTDLFAHLKTLIFYDGQIEKHVLNYFAICLSQKGAITFRNRVHILPWRQIKQCWFSFQIIDLAYLTYLNI